MVMFSCYIGKCFFFICSVLFSSSNLNLTKVEKNENFPEGHFNLPENKAKEGLKIGAHFFLCGNLSWTNLCSGCISKVTVFKWFFMRRYANIAMFFLTESNSLDTDCDGTRKRLQRSIYCFLSPFGS